MPYATSTEIIAAAARASSWGTPAACGAGDGLLILPHTIRKTAPLSLDDSIGSAFASNAEQGVASVGGGLPCYLRYDGLDLLLALAMGRTGGAPTQQGATSAYAQSFELAASLDGLFATLALYDTVNVHEYTSAKLAGFTIKGEVGAALTVTFNVIADDHITGSATNTAATMATVTLPGTANRVLMSQAVFRMNGRDGSALSGPDELRPASFELAYTRPMKGSAAIGQATDRIGEPAATGPAEVKLSLTLPRYSGKTHFDDWSADAPKKMDITFTGGLIESPQSRVFRLSFPHLRYERVELPQERGALSHPLTFHALAAAAAPAGMSGITLPFQADVVNTNPSDVLG